MIMGVEKGSFAFLVFCGVFALVAKAYQAFPIVVLMYLIARWLSKKDDQYAAMLLKYLNEEHVYDATPRISDTKTRPKGWGRNLPK